MDGGVSYRTLKPQRPQREHSLFSPQEGSTESSSIVASEETDEGGSKAEARINPAHHPWLSLPPAPEKSRPHLRDTWAHSASLRTCHYLLLLFVWSKGQGLRPWDLDTAQGSLSVC